MKHTAYFFTVVMCFLEYIPARGHEVRIQDLIQEASSASSAQEMLAFLKKSERLPEGQLRSFIMSAAESRSAKVRLMAALLMSRLSEQDVQAVFKSLSEDRSEEIRVVAWLSIEWQVLSKSQVDAAFKSNVPLIRASAVLASDDAVKVASHTLDGSPVVRAVAIRRLGKLYVNDPVDGRGVTDALLKDALRNCLVDHDVLVRSNALITARALLTTPNQMAAVLLDARHVVAMEELLAGEGEEDAALRAEWGLKEAFYPTFAVLRDRFLKTAIPNLPPPSFNMPVIPSDQNWTIGGYFASVLIHVDRNRNSEVIDAIVRMSPLAPALDSQLLETLVK